jgi:signal transduction histidine kinase
VDNGCVVVSTELSPERDVVRVVVADNGRGIPAEDIDKMFGLFVSRKGGRGTGLGLPVSKKILREHGGDIRVESEVGRGSRFILEWPAVPIDTNVTARREDVDSAAP